jgi:hypothetical protein
VHTRSESDLPIRPVSDEVDDTSIFKKGQRAPFAGWSDCARGFAAAEKLEPNDHKAYLRTLLYPARL